MDENETSFSPDSNGTFAFPIAPGQYSVCILPDNPDANITFPIEEKKGYLTWVDFESTSDPLIFGIQDNTESQDNNQTQTQQSRSDDNQASQDNSSEKNELIRPEEVNALYERLLQEMESKSKIWMIKSEDYWNNSQRERLLKYKMIFTSNFAIFYTFYSRVDFKYFYFWTKY